MTTFAGFIAAVVLYVAFLIWCLLPLVWRRRWRGRWLRVSLGVVLLSANLLPLLGIPVVLMASVFGTRVAERAWAVILFPRTLPLYVSNRRDRENTDAVVIEISYPI